MTKRTKISYCEIDEYIIAGVYELDLYDRSLKPHRFLLLTEVLVALFEELGRTLNGAATIATVSGLSPEAKMLTNIEDTADRWRTVMKAEAGERSTGSYSFAVMPDRTGLVMTVLSGEGTAIQLQASKESFRQMAEDIQRALRLADKPNPSTPILQ